MLSLCVTNPTRVNISRLTKNLDLSSGNICKLENKIYRHAERYFKRNIDPYLPGSNKYWGIDLPVLKKKIKYAGALNLPVSNK